MVAFGDPAALRDRGSDRGSDLGFDRGLHRDRGHRFPAFAAVSSPLSVEPLIFYSQRVELLTQSSCSESWPRLLLPARSECCRRLDCSPAATIARVVIRQALKVQCFASIGCDSGRRKTPRRSQQ